MSAASSSSEAPPGGRKGKSSDEEVIERAAEVSSRNATGNLSRQGASRRKPRKTRKVEKDTEDSDDPTFDEDSQEKRSLNRKKDGNLVLEDGTMVVEPEDADDSDQEDVKSSRKTKPKARKNLFDPDTILSCTACNRQINQHAPGNIKRHPVLKVLICKKCYQWYTSDEIDQDSNGIDEQCRWCGEGGNLLLCDFCHNAFCKMCIKRNLGRSQLQTILDAGDDDKWKCYVCDAEPLQALREDCDHIIRTVEEEEQKKKLAEERRKHERENRKSLKGSKRSTNSRSPSSSSERMPKRAAVQASPRVLEMSQKLMLDDDHFVITPDILNEVLDKMADSLGKTAQQLKAMQDKLSKAKKTMNAARVMEVKKDLCIQLKKTMVKTKTMYREVEVFVKTHNQMRIPDGVSPIRSSTPKRPDLLGGERFGRVVTLPNNQQMIVLKDGRSYPFDGEVPKGYKMVIQQKQQPAIPLKEGEVIELSDSEESDGEGNTVKSPKKSFQFRVNLSGGGKTLTLPTKKKSSKNETSAKGKTKSQIKEKSEEANEQKKSFKKEQDEKDNKDEEMSNDNKSAGDKNTTKAGTGKEEVEHGSNNEVRANGDGVEPGKAVAELAEAVTNGLLDDIEPMETNNNGGDEEALVQLDGNDSNVSLDQTVFIELRPIGDDEDDDGYDMPNGDIATDDAADVQDEPVKPQNRQITRGKVTAKRKRETESSASDSDGKQKAKKTRAEANRTREDIEAQRKLHRELQEDSSESEDSDSDDDDDTSDEESDKPSSGEEYDPRADNRQLRKDREEKIEKDGGKRKGKEKKEKIRVRSYMKKSGKRRKNREKDKKKKKSSKVNEDESDIEKDKKGKKKKGSKVDDESDIEKEQKGKKKKGSKVDEDESEIEKDKKGKKKKGSKVDEDESDIEKDKKGKKKKGSKVDEDESDIEQDKKRKKKKGKDDKDDDSDSDKKKKSKSKDDSDESEFESSSKKKSGKKSKSKYDHDKSDSLSSSESESANTSKKIKSEDVDSEIDTTSKKKKPKTKDSGESGKMPVNKEESGEESDAEPSSDKDSKSVKLENDKDTKISKGDSDDNGDSDFDTKMKSKKEATKVRRKSSRSRSTAKEAEEPGDQSESNPPKTKKEAAKAERKSTRSKSANKDAKESGVETDVISKGKKETAKGKASKSATAAEDEESDNEAENSKKSNKGKKGKGSKDTDNDSADDFEESKKLRTAVNKRSEKKGKGEKDDEDQKKKAKHTDESDYDSDLEKEIEKLGKLPVLKIRKLKIEKNTSGELSIKEQDDEEEKSQEEKSDNKNEKGKKSQKEQKVEPSRSRRDRARRDILEELESEGSDQGDAEEDEDDVIQLDSIDSEKEFEKKKKKAEELKKINEEEKARKALLEISSEDEDEDEDDEDDDGQGPKKNGRVTRTRNGIKKKDETDDSDIGTRKSSRVTTKLLNVKISSDDSDDDIKAPAKKKPFEDDSSDNSFMMSSAEENNDKDEDEDLPVPDSDSDSLIGKRGRKVKDSDDSDTEIEDNNKAKKGKGKAKDSDDSDTDLDVGKKKKGKKGKGKAKDSDDTDSDVGKKKKRRRRIKKAASSSESENSDTATPRRKRKKKGEDDDDEDDDEDGEPGSAKGKAKNIRKIMKDKKLKDETKAAARAEEERRQRIKERQRLYNQVVIEESGGVAKCPITTKLVLECTDDDKKKPIIEAHPKLIRKLKPHQVEAVKFLWDCCVESLERLKKEEGGGCILAHCMGLGKTLSVITFVHTLMSHAKKTKITRCLVVCPLNTVLNWQKEWTKWFDDIDDDELWTPYVYELASIKNNWGRVEALTTWHEDGGIMILSYEMYRNLTQHKFTKNKKHKQVFTTTLVDPGPDLVICDEGHVLKNDGSALAKAMNSIKTRRRVVLTGTPLQNNLIEYHCMVSFVKPNLLGTRKEFANRFVNPMTNGQCSDSTPQDVKLMKKRAHILHETLAGCVQRQDYTALTKFLPPKHEYVVLVRLCPVQLKLYEEYLKLTGQVEGHVITRGGRLFQDFNHLMRIWTHPWILKLDEIRQENKRMYDDESSFVDDEEEESEMSLSESSDDNKKKKNKKDKEGSEEPRPGTSRGKEGSGDEVEVVKDWKTRSRTRQAAANGVDLDEDDKKDVDEKLSSEWWAQYLTPDDQYKVELSGKITLLAEILKMSEAIGDKILVFSQSLLSLDLIEDFLEYWDKEGLEVAGLQGWTHGLDYFRMDGSTQAHIRKRWQEEFNDPDNTRARLFLISTKAGGIGINLIGANRVIIFDSSWNPSHDVQSIFRVYRFGQEKPVYIYRFLSQGTMEEKIYNRQVTKQSLALRVVDEQQIERHFTYSDLKELYTFTPDRLDDGKEKPTPILPKDRMLAELLTDKKEWIVNYIEHDSLLENKVEEDLTEEERKTAWEEYEDEKKGIRKSYSFAGYNAAMALQMQQQQQIMMQQRYAAAMSSPSVDESTLTHYARALYDANPDMSADELQQRLQQLVYMQMQQQIQQQQQLMLQRQIERARQQNESMQEQQRLLMEHYQQQQQKQGSDSSETSAMARPSSFPNLASAIDKTKDKDKESALKDLLKLSHKKKK